VSKKWRRLTKQSIIV